jgi:hypothetical protein
VRAAADSEADDLKLTASELTLLLQSWRQSGQSTTSLSSLMYGPAWWRRRDTALLLSHVKFALHHLRG